MWTVVATEEVPVGLTEGPNYNVEQEITKYRNSLSLGAVNSTTTVRHANHIGVNVFQTARLEVRETETHI